MEVVWGRRRTALAVLIVTLIGLSPLCAPRNVRASPSVAGHWEQVPLYGGVVTSLVVDPQDSAKVYVGTSGGVCRSIDHGTTWKRVSDDLPDRTYTCLAIDPTNSSAIYAGTFGGGVALSRDSGATWSAASAKVDGWNFWCLAVSPRTPSTVYTGTSLGVWKSADRGDSWTSAGLLDEDVHSLAVDPATSTVFAGTDKGVSRSSDGGSTWVQCSSGITDLRVACLALDSSTPSTLYAGTQGAGIFRSRDGGQSWTAISRGLTGASVRCLAIDYSAPTTLYAGLMDKQGAFRSVDSGDSWEPISKGLNNKSVFALAIDQTTPSTLYAASSQQGVFKTTDAGVSWEESNTGLYIPFVMSLVSDNGTPAVVHVASYSGYSRCDDVGRLWWDFAALLPVRDMSIFLTSPSVLYAAAGSYGVYYSKNGGDSWMRFQGPADRDISCVVVDPISGSTILVGTDSGVFRSTSLGQSWTQASTDLTNERIRCLTIDSTAPSIIYAGTDSGIFCSNDLGDSWKKTSDAPLVGSIAVDPHSPTTVYAAGLAGVNRSIDRGVTWELCSDPLMIRGVTAVTVDTEKASTVYAGTTEGVFRSEDGGKTWTDASAGLPTSMVNDLCDVAGTPATVFACTDRGLFRWIPTSPPSVPDGFIWLTSQAAVTLIWQASAAGSSSIGGYAVYRSTTTGHTGDVPVATVGAAMTSWTDTTCQQGVTYYYTVAAFDSQTPPLYSAKSSEVSAELQPLPPEPVVVTLTLQMGSTTMQVSASDGTADTVTLDAAPVLGAGNRTLVPVRAVAEAMGGTVSWDPATRTASVTVGSNTLELTLGSNIALFHGAATPIDSDPKVVPLIINGRTMLPLRFVVESLGAEVAYDQATKTITITYTKS